MGTAAGKSGKFCLPRVAMPWVVLMPSLKTCCDSHACLQIWLPPHPEDNGFHFSSAAQTSYNFLSKGNSTHNEIGKGNLRNTISQTLEAVDINAEVAADSPSQHPYPVSDLSTLANIYCDDPLLSVIVLSISYMFSHRSLLTTPVVV